jgi:hypothetical protein
LWLKPTGAPANQLGLLRNAERDHWLGEKPSGVLDVPKKKKPGSGEASSTL